MRALTSSLFTLLWACTGDIRTASPNPIVPVMPSVDSQPQPEPALEVKLPAAATCGGAIVGRSYMSFLGQPLESDRPELAAGQDLRRVRDGSDLGEFFILRGIEGPKVDRSTMQAFGVTPEHWYETNKASFASVYAAYAMAFHGCLEKVLRPRNYHPFDDRDYASSPTRASAQRQCQVMGKMLWKRPMEAAELDACVDYALEVVTLEPNPQRQWAYLCASVAGSADFLVF